MKSTRGIWHEGAQKALKEEYGMIRVEDKNGCKLYNLIMSFAECNKNIAGAALNGCACLIECEEGTRDFMLADYGIRKTKALEKDIERLRESIEEKSVCAHITRCCMEELLPILEEIYEEDSDYTRTVDTYNKHTSLNRIFEDAVNGMDRDMFWLFTNSADPYDIRSYRKKFESKKESFENAGIRDGSKELTVDVARDLLRKYGYLDDKEDDTDDDLFDEDPDDVGYLNQDEIYAILDDMMEEDAEKNTDHNAAAVTKKNGDEAAGGE